MGERGPKHGKQDGMTFRRLPSGRWQAGVWDADLRRYRYATHPTRAEAERQAAATAARFVLKQDSAAAASLDRVWSSYASERYGISADEAEGLATARGGAAKAAAALRPRMRANWRTVLAMQNIVRSLRGAGIDDLKAPTLRARIAAWFNRLDLSRTKAADGRVAVSTRRRMLTQVRALVNHARSAGWLHADPLAGLRVVNDREQADTGRETFTLAECRRLVALRRLDDPVWIHAVLMLYAGLRDAEARAMTWADYEADRRLLWVRRGKGGKMRAVPVQRELADLLADIAAACGPAAPHPCLPTSPIARPTPGRDLGRYANFTALLHDAGVIRHRGTDPISGMPRALCRHSCRHTFAAMMLASGEDGDALRIAMGHGHAALTMLYAAQAMSFRAEIEAEAWQRGRLHLVAPPLPSARHG